MEDTIMDARIVEELEAAYAILSPPLHRPPATSDEIAPQLYCAAFFFPSTFHIPRRHPDRSGATWFPNRKSSIESPKL